MKIAICQTNPVIGDFDHNTTLVENAVDRAKRSGCHLIVFPELTLPGYPANDLLEKPEFIKLNLTRLEALASGIRGISVLCGYVSRVTKTPLFSLKLSGRSRSPPLSPLTSDSTARRAVRTASCPSLSFMCAGYHFPPGFI